MLKVAWTVDGRTYFLNPSYTVGEAGRHRITGAEMYDKDNEYIGYWYRENMPQQLLGMLLKHVKQHMVLTPVYDTRGKRLTRKPRRQ